MKWKLTKEVLPPTGATLLLLFPGNDIVFLGGYEGFGLCLLSPWCIYDNEANRYFELEQGQTPPEYWCEVTLPTERSP